MDLRISCILRPLWSPWAFHPLNFNEYLLNNRSVYYPWNARLSKNNKAIQWILLSKYLLHARLWLLYHYFKTKLKRRLFQDSRVEEHALSSWESPQISTSCGTAMDRRMLEPTKERCPTFKDKGEAATGPEEGSNHNKIKSHTDWVDNPQTGEQ